MHKEQLLCILPELVAEVADDGAEGRFAVGVACSMPSGIEDSDKILK